MKKVLSIILSMVVLVSLAGGAAAESGREGFVNTGKLTYDVNAQVNNGDEMTLEFWVQVEVAEIYQKWCDAYTALHPNIKFNLTQGSNADHFQKLGMALPSGTGPQLFHMHNSYIDQFMANLKPYDPEIIPLDALGEDFIAVDECLYGGNLYYAGLAVMSCGVFYNTQMWADAGLNDDDIPKTWDELAQVAKKLTQYDSSGKVAVAGFNYNEMSMEYLITALNYHKGIPMFAADGRTPVFNDGFKATVQWLKDLYEVENAGSVELPMSILSFSQGTSAMTYIGTWFGNWMKQNAPDMGYSFFMLPSVDGQTPPAYDRYNIEVAPAINASVSDAEYAVINDFLCFLRANDHFVLDFSLMMYGTPTKKCLLDNAEVQSDIVLGATARHMDRLIYPGAYPESYSSALKKYFYDEVMLNHMDIDEAMGACKEEIVDALDVTGFESIENKYPHADELAF